MSAITVAVDDVALSISDTTWLWIAPCGCAWGAYATEVGGRVILDAATVAKEFYDTARERKQREKAGFHFELRPRREVMRCTDPCDHTQATP